jgi:2-dehydro-3-deoxyphosphooctonate aldolase (KDO 8-P synthase)
MSRPNSSITIGDATFANDAPLALIAGPCQLESRQHAFDMAGALKELTERLGIGSSTSRASTRRTAPRWARRAAPGSKWRCRSFADIRKEFGLPVLTDVHT